MVAINRKYSLHHDEDPPSLTLDSLVRPFQDRLQIVKIIVCEGAELGAAETRGIHDAGMDQFINDDDILLAQECTDRSHSGGISAGETYRGCCAFECGESFIQLLMRGERPADQPRSAGSNAIALDGFEGGGFQRGVVRQA